MCGHLAQASDKSGLQTLQTKLDLPAVWGQCRWTRFWKGIIIKMLDFKLFIISMKHEKPELFYESSVWYHGMNTGTHSGQKLFDQ